MKLWRGQPDHDHWRTPFTPQEKAYAWWGLSAVALVSAVIKVFYPDAVPSTYKIIGMFERLAFDQFGSAGITGLWFVLAGVMFVAGVLQWQKGRSK
jgi:hypothetical protein